MKENKLQEKYRILEVARQLIKNRDFENALEYLDKCADCENIADEILLEKIKIFSEQGQFEKVIKEISENIAEVNNIQILNNLKLFIAKAFSVTDNLYEAKKNLDSVTDTAFKNTETYSFERLNISVKLYNYLFRVSSFSGDEKELKEEFCIIRELQPYNVIHLSFIARVSNYLCDYEFTKELINKYKYLVKEEDCFYRNLILNEYEIASKQTVLKSKPRYMWIAVSSKCNLKCRMCSTNEEFWELSDRNMEDIYSCMPYLEHITWWGGEPLIDDKFYKMLEFSLRYKNIQHSVITNGQYMPQKFIDLAISNSIEVVFSVDSVKKDLYEKIRVNGSFEKLEQNISKLTKIYKHKLVKINVVLMDWNKDETSEIIAFAEKYGIKSVSFIPLGSRGKFTEHSLKKNDFESVRFSLGKFEKDNDIFIFENDEKNLYKQAENSDGCISICNVPWTSVNILYNGILFAENLCSNFYGYGVPLKSVELSDFWNSSYMVGLRSKIINGHFCSKNCPKANIRYK